MVFVLVAFNYMSLPRTIYDIGLHYGWSGSQKGDLLSAGSIGFIFAALVSGYLSELFGKKQVLVFGLLFSLVGNIAFGYLPEIGLSEHFSFYFFLLFNFLIGAGGGIIEGLTNALLMHLHPEKSSFYLNLAHAFFALGAIISPLMAGWLILISGWQMIFYLNAAISFFLLIGLFFQSCPPFRSDEKMEFKTLLALAKNRVFLLLNLSIVFYVATETGLVAWMVEYVRTHPGFKLSQFQSGVFLTYFWIAMLIGRSIYGWWVEKTSSRFALAVSSVGGMISISLFLFAKSPQLASVLIFVCGGFLSGMFATIFSVGGERFPHYLGVISGSMAASVGIGGIISPNVIGRLSDIPGAGITAGLATCVVYLLGVFVVVMTVFKSSR